MPDYAYHLPTFHQDPAARPVKRSLDAQQRLDDRRQEHQELIEALACLRALDAAVATGGQPPRSGVVLMPIDADFPEEGWELSGARLVSLRDARVMRSRRLAAFEEQLRVALSSLEGRLHGVASEIGPLERDVAAGPASPPTSPPTPNPHSRVDLTGGFGLTPTVLL